MDFRMPAWVRRARRSDLADRALELKFFLKEHAVERLEELCEYAQSILESLERAAEMGKEWAGVLIAEIRAILGYHDGCHPSTPGGEVELSDMAVEYFPTE